MEHRYENTIRNGSGLTDGVEFIKREDAIAKEFAKDNIELVYTYERRDCSKSLDTFRILKQGNKYFCTTMLNGGYEANSLAECLLFGFSNNYISLDEYRHLCKLIRGE